MGIRNSISKLFKGPDKESTDATEATPQQSEENVAPARRALRDLIYLDAGKAASIYSQLAGGLPGETQQVLETASVAKVAAGVFVPMAALGSNLESSERRGLTESSVMHHSLLVRVEEEIESRGLITVMSESYPFLNLDALRLSLTGSSYLRADGWATVDDYLRLQLIASNLKSIIEFVTKSAVETLKKSDQYRGLQDQIAAAKTQVSQIKDRNQKTIANAAFRALELQVEAMLDRAGGSVGQVDDWLVEGMGHFIDVFMPGYITLRVYPFEELPEFHVLANLRRDLFVDGNPDSFLFAYGSQPNLRLTVLGLMTSLPSRSGHPFDAMAEFEGLSADDPRTFEKAFRTIFAALRPMEDLVRFSRYPNVTIHPIALYRTIWGSTPDQSK